MNLFTKQMNPKNPKAPKSKFPEFQHFPCWSDCREAMLDVGTMRWVFCAPGESPPGK